MESESQHDRPLRLPVPIWRPVRGVVVLRVEKVADDQLEVETPVIQD